MNSITNYSHQKFDFKLYNRKVIDFQLADYDGRDAKDSAGNLIMDLKESAGVLISNIEWKDKTTSIGSIATYGLTGVDNGAIPYVDDTSLTTSVLNIPAQLELKPVKGYQYTDLSAIDYTIVNNADGVINFRGGFYQGFYKLEGYDYQVLPNRFKDGWTIHTSLKPLPISIPNSLNTLEDDTKGIFFYMGTRAENKFWNTFPGLNPTIETEKETTYTGVTEHDFIIPLNPPRVLIKEMTNEFLIYGRSDGKTYCGEGENFGFGTKVAGTFETGQSLFYKSFVALDNVNEINPFLKYGRSDGKTYCGTSKEDNYGESVASQDGSRYDLSDELDLYKDIVDNAIAFRVTVDGRVGYRRIVSPDCDSQDKYVVVEEYSNSGLVPDEMWSNVTLKWVPDEELKCEYDEPRLGNLYLYIDGYLKHIFRDFKEIINRPLFEHKDKQVGVPYNISIGGGTQGLKESMTFDGPDPSDKDLPLEQHFAGSFIGDMVGFKIYDTPLTWCEIKEDLN